MKRVETFEDLVNSGGKGFLKQIMMFNKRFIKGSSAEKEINKMIRE